MAAEIALLNNFVWNELWTFGNLSTAKDHWYTRSSRLVKFNLICLAGIGLGIFLLNLQIGFHGNKYLSSQVTCHMMVGFLQIWHESSSSAESKPKTRSPEKDASLRLP